MSEPRPAGGSGPSTLERLTKFFTSLAGVITAVVALGGAVAGGAALIKSQGEDGDNRKDAVFTGSPPSVDINVPLGTFLGGSGQQPPADADLKRVGNVFYVRADTEGFKRETLRLKWFTYDANNHTRLPGLRGSAKAERLFKPQAPIDTQIAQVWVPTPSIAGRYFVRFELYSGDVLLAFVDSKPYESLGDI